MSKEQKIARIEELKALRFYLSCKDWWTNQNYKDDREWLAEILRLEKEIA